MNYPPIAVLDEHPDWLDPLYMAFDERGVSYKKIDISTFSYDPQSKEHLPFYINRLSPSALNRGHESAFAFTLDYITHLESLGARVVGRSPPARGQYQGILVVGRLGQGKIIGHTIAR